MCVDCGGPILYGERVEFRCGGRRQLPCISLDGESQAIEERSHEVTLDLVHRECGGVMIDAATVEQVRRDGEEATRRLEERGWASHRSPAKPWHWRLRRRLRLV